MTGAKCALHQRVSNHLNLKSTESQIICRRCKSSATVWRRPNSKLVRSTSSNNCYRLQHAVFRERTENESSQFDERIGRWFSNQFQHQFGKHPNFGFLNWAMVELISKQSDPQLICLQVCTCWSVRRAAKPIQSDAFSLGNCKRGSIRLKVLEHPNNPFKRIRRWPDDARNPNFGWSCGQVWAKR